jgi:hypothetical protein
MPGWYQLNKPRARISRGTVSANISNGRNTSQFSAIFRMTVAASVHVSADKKPRRGDK